MKICPKTRRRVYQRRREKRIEQSREANPTQQQAQSKKHAKTQNKNSRNPKAGIKTRATKNARRRKEKSASSGTAKQMQESERSREN